MPEPRVRSIEEAEVVIQSLYARQAIAEDLARDLTQRFDTLQTPWYKRVLYTIDGWPWYNLNADRPKWRPWRKWWHS